MKAVEVLQYIVGFIVVGFLAVVLAGLAIFLFPLIVLLLIMI